MNILIVGYGDTGAQLVNSLLNQDHAISVIDKDEASFEHLNPEFTGMLTAGMATDITTLKKAGIEQCDVVVVVTNNDNVNIMVAQIAKKIFNIDKIIVKVQDSVKSEVFADLGFNVISTTNLSVNEIKKILKE